MLKLFGRTEESPEERLAGYQRKKDWAGLAKACYSLGTAAMDQGDLNRAVLWLHRADTIYSARDEVYDKVGEKLIDDCSDRIAALENAPLLYNSIPAEIDEKAAVLGDSQIRLWGLLSISRLVTLGRRLGGLPGCEVLGDLGWAVDTVLKSFQTPVTQEEYNRLMDICSALYELGDSESFYGGGEIGAAGGAPFQVFDLNGMMGAHLELNAYLDNHLRFLAALSQEQEPPAAESSIAGCALLPDYYVRTLGGSPEDVPRIRAELERIWSDYEFLRAGLTWEQVTRRIELYKALDILA